MNTLHTLPDGTRLVLIPAPEWDGLTSAVEIAFQDEESVPEEMREVGGILWQAFHGGHTPAQQRIIDDTNAIQFERQGERLAASIRPSPEEVARHAKIRDAVDAVVRLLPAALGVRTGVGFTTWHRGSDLAGTVNWSSETYPVVYATPNWEGEPSTPLNIGDGGDQSDLFGTLPFDATKYVGHEAEGAREYVRLITEVLERVAGSFEQVIDGTATFRMFPWPSGGCFLGVMRDSSGAQAVLMSCPMNADGSPDTDNVGDVENIEGLDLGPVNAFFGTAFTDDQFCGR